MLNKNYMAGNVHLSSEVAEPFDIRLKKEKPELAAGVDKLKTYGYIVDKDKYYIRK